MHSIQNIKNWELEKYLEYRQIFLPEKIKHTICRRTEKRVTSQRLGHLDSNVMKSLKGWREKSVKKRVLCSMKALSQHIQESRYFHEIRMIPRDRLENVLRWMNKKTTNETLWDTTKAGF